jgi:hypothetical protein
MAERAPRYRFPDRVRSTTRDMASEMVRDGTVPETSEQLEAWIAGTPGARGALEAGGYGTRFGAQDLLPLLHGFVEREGGVTPGETPRGAGRGRFLVLGAALVILALLIVLAAGVL